MKNKKSLEDPEIPKVNIYELGLIYFVNVYKKSKYKIKLTKLIKGTKFDVEVEMTLTSPNCPVAESLPEEVRTKVENLDSVNECKGNNNF